MKYANIYWQNPRESGPILSINIGDNLQFFVIDYLYQQLSINSEEIVRLQMRDVKTYQGEPIVLPLNWTLFDLNFMEGDRLAISDWITPIFLAATIEAASYQESFLNTYNIAYLKKHAPIGCRDTYTKEMLQRWGVPAYLNGCLTAAFPKRSVKASQDQVFLADAPIGLKETMPKDIAAHCAIMTQQYYFSADTPIAEILENVKRQYQKLADEARLVITSRLHIASPCMAMGIPVILAKDQLDGRFDWIDQYLPTYDMTQYTDIDWFPQAIDREEDKLCILRNAKSQILGLEDRYKSFYEVERLYKNRSPKTWIHFPQLPENRIHKAVAFLQAKFRASDHFSYCIWGANDEAEKFYQYVCEKYPNASLRAVIDSYKSVEFHGIKTVHPRDYVIGENEVIIVLPVKASSSAQRFFQERGVSARRAICCGDIFIEEEKDNKIFQAAALPGEETR